MNVEELLRDSLAAEADHYQPSPDLWSRINEGVGRRRRRWSWPVLLPLATAASMATVAGIVLLTNDEASDQVVTVPPAAPITITTAPPLTTIPVTVECPDIPFTPNTEDIAADIKATGTGCTEASAFVRKVRQEHNPYSGPRAFRLDGFTCQVVSDETGDLPVGHYTCTAGVSVITWTKH